MKWWLVSDDDLNEVRKMLGEAIKNAVHDQSYKDALHALETGMHKTDAVPADFDDAAPRADSTGTKGE